MISQYTDRFEKAHFQGQWPAISDYLPPRGPGFLEVARELVAIDLEFHRRHGRRVILGPYVDLVPELTKDQEAALVMVAADAADRRDRGEDPAPSDYTSSFPDFGDLIREQWVDLLAGEPETLPSVPGYEILGLLGRGGMGIVYKAKHQAFDRLVALKMLAGRGGVSSREKRRFLNEARAAAHLHHPNIVTVHDLGEARGIPYFSQELAEGGSLDRELARERPQPQEAAQLVEALARAMHYAHGQGLIHRDLKPANILLVRRGSSSGSPEVRDPMAAVAGPARLSDFVPKVGDFGLAHHRDYSNGTATGALLGTPPYMAPEVAAGTPAAATTAVDVYGLGAILYELLAGRAPFLAEGDQGIVDQILTQDPTPPSRYNPSCPRDLEAVCLRCLEKEPARRYSTAEALADDLRRFLDGDSTVARPLGLRDRAMRWTRRHPAFAAVLAFAVVVPSLLTVVLTLVVLSLRETAEQKRLALVSAEERAHELGQANEALRNERDRSRTTLRASVRGVREVFNNISEHPALDTAGAFPLKRYLQETALRFYETTSEEWQGDPELAEDMADTLCRRARLGIGTREESLTYLERACSIQDRLCQEYPQVSRYQVALSCMCAIQASFARWIPSKRSDARPLAEKALTLAVAVRRASPEDVPALWAHGQALQTLADVLGEEGHHAEAFARRVEADSVYDRLRRENPRAFNALMAHVMSRTMTGVAASEAGRPTEAVLWYEKAQSLLGETPTEQRTRLWYRREAGRVSNALGAALLTLAQASRKSGKSESEVTLLLRRASASLNEAQVCREALSAETPDNVDSLGDLVSTLGNQAHLAGLEHRHQEQVRLARRTCDLREEHLKRAGGVAVFRSFASSNYACLADGLAALGRLEEALDAYRQARRHGASEPAQLAKIARDFARRMGDVKPSVGRERCLDQILETLEEAVSRGYAHSPTSTNEADFAVIRTHPRFLALGGHSSRASGRR